MNRVQKPMVYTRDEEWNPVPCFDVLEWTEWKMNEENCRVDKTEWMHGEDEICVSTVYLAMPHLGSAVLESDDPFQPYWFETMVFSSDRVLNIVQAYQPDDLSSPLVKMFQMIFGIQLGPEIQLRWRTVQEARAGHAGVVAMVRQALAAGN